MEILYTHQSNGYQLQSKTVTKYCLITRKPYEVTRVELATMDGVAFIAYEGITRISIIHDRTDYDSIAFEMYLHSLRDGSEIARSL